MKELPKMYRNKIEKELTNNERIYSSLFNKVPETLTRNTVKEITPNKETNNETAKWNNFAEVVGNKVKVIPTPINMIEFTTIDIREMYFSFMSLHLFINFITSYYINNI